MLFKGLGSFDGHNQEAMHQERYWHDDMLWYGPYGIGTTYGLNGFKQDHQWPFLVAFPNRVGGNHNTAQVAITTHVLPKVTMLLLRVG
jgi:hypothetical protein